MCPPSEQRESGTLSLAGEWQFALDPDGVGVDDEWYDDSLPDAVALPGSTDENGKGERARRRASDHLTRERRYEGAAWYRRTVSIPESWAGQRVTLHLERTRSTRVWVDGRDVGGDDSLSTPHVYELGSLAPGRHAITVRVDNASDVFDLPGVRRSHAATEHTQTNWNGVVGAMRLEATDPVHVTALRTDPDPEARSVTVETTVRNRTSAAATGRLSLETVGLRDENAMTASIHETQAIEVAADETTVISTEVELGDDAPRWDEWTPTYYELSAGLDVTVGDDEYADVSRTQFGLRTFEPKGTQFAVNGRTTFLRGNVDSCIFPKTGYPPTGVDAWRDVFETAKAYGLNHYRFHSWCPPEAAFRAADELGVYLQPELPCWNNGSAFEDPFAVEYYRSEAERILDAYGHHPSFVMFALGNELSGDQDEMIALVDHCRSYDPRHVYATGSYNFLSNSTVTESDDYWTTASIPTDLRDAEGDRFDGPRRSHRRRTAGDGDRLLRCHRGRSDAGRRPRDRSVSGVSELRGVGKIHGTTPAGEPRTRSRSPRSPPATRPCRRVRGRLRPTRGRVLPRGDRSRASDPQFRRVPVARLAGFPRSGNRARRYSGLVSGLEGADRASRLAHVLLRDGPALATRRPDVLSSTSGYARTHNSPTTVRPRSRASRPNGESATRTGRRLRPVRSTRPTSRKGHSPISARSKSISDRSMRSSPVASPSNSPSTTE